MWWKTKKEKEFEQIYQSYKREVFFTAYRMSRNNELALEITQEVFLKVYQTDLSKIENVRAWLRKVTYNHTLNYLKKYKTNSVVELKDFLGEKEKRFEEVEWRDYLEKAFLLLTPKERAVIILRVKEEKSYQEIADILNIPIGTVMSRLNSARKKLSLKLKEKRGAKDGD